VAPPARERRWLAAQSMYITFLIAAIVLGASGFAAFSRFFA
jgi:hypothetical protein